MNAIFTKPDAYRAIESMPSREQVISEIKEAEKSVADGNYVTSEQLHDLFACML